LHVSTSPVIINNTIKGSITTGKGIVLISGNQIYGSIESNGEKNQITDNVLFGQGYRSGIRAGIGGVIERNLITDYYNAIEFWLGASPIIRNNTIINNVNAISIPGYIKSTYSAQIYWNNIYNNSGYNVNLYTHEAHPQWDINATYNWWGITDVDSIEQAIHDFNVDFNLGKVDYTPFLTQPNPQTIPDIGAPLPAIISIPTIATTTASPPVSGNSALFGSDWIGIAIIALLSVVFVVLFFVVVFLRRR